jgi:flagellar hook-length control protein FliK
VLPLPEARHLWALDLPLPPAASTDAGLLRTQATTLQAVPLTHLAPLAVAIARDPGNGALEVGLSPEELGQMHMQVATEGEVLRIAMTVERPETLDLLRRHADQLLADLRQAGFGGAALSFHQGQAGTGQAGAGQTGEGRPGGGQAGEGGTAIPPAATPAPAPPRSTAAGLGHAPLDLRL